MDYYRFSCTATLHTQKINISDNDTNKKPAITSWFLNIGTPKGNRTPVTAVKGRCPNR